MVSSLHTRGKIGDTLFHLAAAYGHINIIYWMNSIGGIVNSVNIYGQTPAHIAAKRIQINILKYLYYDLDVDLLQEDFNGQIPLDYVPKQDMYGNEKDLIETRLFLINIFNNDSY